MHRKVSSDLREEDLVGMPRTADQTIAIPFYETNCDLSDDPRPSFPLAREAAIKSEETVCNDLHPFKNINSRFSTCSLVDWWMIDDCNIVA